MNNGDRINKKNVFKIIVIAMVLLCPLIVITIGGVSKAFYSDDLPVLMSTMVLMLIILTLMMRMSIQKMMRK